MLTLQSTPWLICATPILLCLGSVASLGIAMMVEGNVTPRLCPLHDTVKERLDKIERIAGALHCEANTVRIAMAEKNFEELWEAINQLKRIVYMGVGIAAALSFVGSILGGLIRAGMKP